MVRGCRGTRGGRGGRRAKRRRAAAARKPREEHVQGVRWRGSLPAPAHQEQVQGVPGGRASTRTIASGAGARSAGPLREGEHLPAPAPKKWVECKECGTASICPHHCIRRQFKECGGTSICRHQRRRSECKECGGGEHLPAPLHQEQVQGVRGGEHLTTPVTLLMFHNTGLCSRPGGGGQCLETFRARARPGQSLT